MEFSNFRFNILLRITGLVVTIFLQVHLFYTNDPIFIQLVVLGLLVYQVLNLVRYIQRSHYALWNFLNSIKYDDVTNTFKATDDPSMGKLKQEFRKAIQHFQQIRQEKEAEFQYLKNIVQHIGIGIITFRKLDGEVQILNTAAKRLLRVTRLDNIGEIKEVNPDLHRLFTTLNTGGRDLIRMVAGEGMIQLAVYAIELHLKGNEYKLISLQNIQSELEEKEMEAWQNLVRVLTHEIMNSITPISSLAETIRQELASRVEEEGPIPKEDAEDFLTAMQTIQKRSEGMIRFVQDFRNLTQIPVPRFDTLQVSELIEEMNVLMKNEIEGHNIHLKTEIEPPNLTINADKQLIEQVLINLVKNAIQAFEDDAESREITISARYNEKSRPIITVKDNGQGIDDEALQRIFIPFYTTKKKGSGIGLSLSRQIMRQHRGSLTVKSEPGTGSEFSLRF